MRPKITISTGDRSWRTGVTYDFETGRVRPWYYSLHPLLWLARVLFGL